LLARARIVAVKITPVGKETDRRWEQGDEDSSMIDPSIHVFEPKGKMCVADPAARKKWSKIAVTKLITESGLSPTTVYKILEVNRFAATSLRASGVWQTASYPEY
jgi:hypothetical protein